MRIETLAERDKRLARKRESIFDSLKSEYNDYLCQGSIEKAQRILAEIKELKDFEYDTIEYEQIRIKYEGSECPGDKLARR